MKSKKNSWKKKTSSSVSTLLSLKREHMRPRFLRNMFFALTASLLFLLWSINPQIMFIVTVSYTIGYLYFVIGYPVVRPFLIGLAVAASYLTFFKHIYNYNTITLHVFSYPLFPLFAWPYGLTVISYVAAFAISRLKIKTFAGKMILSYALFAPLLILVEYVGYHFGNVHLKSHYPPLPFIDCMHMPLNMKVVYFLNGLVFFIALYSFPGERKTKKPSPAESLSLRLMRLVTKPSFSEKMPKEA